MELMPVIRNQILTFIKLLVPQLIIILVCNVFFLDILFKTNFKSSGAKLDLYFWLRKAGFLLKNFSYFWRESWFAQNFCLYTFLFFFVGWGGGGGEAEVEGDEPLPDALVVQAYSLSMWMC